jgi:hypothetical protein
MYVRRTIGVPCVSYEFIDLSYNLTSPLENINRDEDRRRRLYVVTDVVLDYSYPIRGLIYSVSSSRYSSMLTSEIGYLPSDMEAPVRTYTTSSIVVRVIVLSSSIAVMAIDKLPR